MVAALILAEQVAREQGLEDVTPVLEEAPTPDNERKWASTADGYHHEATAVMIRAYPVKPVVCRIQPDSYGDDWRRKGKRKGRRAR
jgi:hypothetical protein